MILTEIMFIGIVSIKNCDETRKNTSVKYPASDMDDDKQSTKNLLYIFLLFEYYPFKIIYTITITQVKVKRESTWSLNKFSAWFIY